MGAQVNPAVVELRGSGSGGPDMALIVGWGFAVVPWAVTGCALATGQVDGMHGGQPPDWPTQLLWMTVWSVCWAGAGTALYALGAWLGRRRAERFRVRLDAEGVEFRDGHRTFRSSWDALRVRYELGDEDTETLLRFESGGESFDYPWLLSEADYAELIGAVRLKRPGLGLGRAFPSPEVQGMTSALEGLLPDLQAQHVPIVRDLCAQLHAKAESGSRPGFGVIPALEACRRAYAATGEPEREAGVAARLQALRSRLGEPP